MQNKQEAQRLQMAAKFGEGQRLQNIRMRGAQRVEDAQMSEAQRLQALVKLIKLKKCKMLELKVNYFMYNQQETKRLCNSQIDYHLN